MITSKNETILAFNIEKVKESEQLLLEPNIEKSISVKDEQQQKGWCEIGSKWYIVLTLLVVYTDVATDLTALFEYLELKLDLYFALLFTGILLERLTSLTLTIIALRNGQFKTRFGFSTSYKALDFLIALLLCSTYLDNLVFCIAAAADKRALEDIYDFLPWGNSFAAALIANIQEGFLESLPSTFVCFHALYYWGETNAVISTRVQQVTQVWLLQLSALLSVLSLASTVADLLYTCSHRHEKKVTLFEKIQAIFIAFVHFTSKVIWWGICSMYSRPSFIWIFTALEWLIALFALQKDLLTNLLHLRTRELGCRQLAQNLTQTLILSPLISLSVCFYFRLSDMYLPFTQTVLRGPAQYLGFIVRQNDQLTVRQQLSIFLFLQSDIFRAGESLFLCALAHLTLESAQLRIFPGFYYLALICTAMQPFYGILCVSKTGRYF